MKHIVALIDKDYRALLADGNIFKALSTARDELRNILIQVGDQFENVLRTQLEGPNPSDQMPAMDINDKGSAAADEKASVTVSTGLGMSVAASTDDQSSAPMVLGHDVARPGGTSSPTGSVEIVPKRET